MAFRSYLKKWPTAKVLGGLTLAGAAALILNRNTQTSFPLSLIASQPAVKPAFRKTGPHFLRLRLHSSEYVSPTTKRLKFELPSPDTVSGLGLCSAVLTAAWPKGSFFPVVRPYSPVSRLDEQGFLELTVKRQPGGKMSTHLHSLTPGDTLLFPGVISSYPWVPNRHDHVTLIAGGAGVTPIFQLAQGILNDPLDTTKVDVIYGVNNDSEILFKDEFLKWRKEFPDRFNATFVVREPGPASFHKKSDINVEVLAELMPRPKGGSLSATRVFISGPPAMEKALLGSRASFRSFRPDNAFRAGNGRDGFLHQLGYSRLQVFNF